MNGSKQRGPKDDTDQMVINKKLTTVALRQAIGFEYNNKQVQIRQEILDSNTSHLYSQWLNLERSVKYFTGGLKPVKQCANLTLYLVQMWIKTHRCLVCMKDP